jgi:hypothetical protein
LCKRCLRHDPILMSSKVRKLALKVLWKKIEPETALVSEMR